jgi:hypothetical protein
VNGQGPSASQRSSCYGGYVHTADYWCVRLFFGILSLNSLRTLTAALGWQVISRLCSRKLPGCVRGRLCQRNKNRRERRNHGAPEQDASKPSNVLRPSRYAELHTRHTAAGFSARPFPCDSRLRWMRTLSTAGFSVCPLPYDSCSGWMHTLQQVTSHILYRVILAWGDSRWKRELPPDSEVQRAAWESLG